MTEKQIEFLKSIGIEPDEDEVVIEEKVGD